MIPDRVSKRFLSKKLQEAATLRIKQAHSAGESAIQNKVSSSDQRCRTQSLVPRQWNWQNAGFAQGRVLVQVELAKRPSYLAGANVERRRCLRKANGRSGFIAVKEPGLQQPNEVQTWNIKGAQRQGR